MKKRIGSWEIKIGPTAFIDKEVIRETERFLNYQWKEALLETADPPWWSVEYLGIPSPIIRVDMAPVGSKAIRESIYEVEARPAGLGLMLSLTTPERVKQWKQIFTACKCQGFVNINSSVQDDKIAAEILGVPYYEFPKETEGPYWVRSNLREGEVTILESISLVPIRQDGDKTYLVKLGMAEEMLTPELLDWSVPFVAKPLVGSRMEGVEIYVPNSLKKKLGPGGSTRSRTLRTITSSEMPYIIQRFIPPQREEREGVQGWTIWRLFFGWQTSQYQFIGGLWNWRPNLRVHGSSDAVFGLVETV